MDEQDERLRQLIATVCQHPDQSQEWRKAMARLLIVVQGLPEFRKYSRPSSCPDYFLDALNRTWEWLSRNIRNFKPRTSFIRADLVNLSRWLQNIFEVGWQSMEALFSTEAANPAFRVIGSQVTAQPTLALDNFWDWHSNRSLTPPLHAQSHSKSNS